MTGYGKNLIKNSGRIKSPRRKHIRLFPMKKRQSTSTKRNTLFFKMQNLFDSVRRWCGRMQFRYCGGIGLSAGELFGVLMEFVPYKKL